MIRRILLIIGLAIAIPACGTKSNMKLPNGKENPKGQKDPSPQPQPIGQ
jgi:predicted small lipoprotein YifL